MSATTTYLTTTQIITEFELESRTTASLIGSKEDLDRTICNGIDITTEAGMDFYKEVSDLYRAVTSVLRSRGYEN